MTERRDEPMTGDVIDRGSVRAYGWEWWTSADAGPLPTAVVRDLPRRVRRAPAAAPGQPQPRDAGSLLFLAAGVAFLVSWLVNRGMGSLYLVAIITALAAPDLLAAADVIEGPGVGTLCLGLAFLFIAVVRAASGAGWGWQAILGAILFAIGGSNLVIPSFSDLVWPIILVALGVIVRNR